MNRITITETRLVKECAVSFSGVFGEFQIDRHDKIRAVVRISKSMDEAIRLFGFIC